MRKTARRRRTRNAAREVESRPEYKRRVRNYRRAVTLRGTGKERDSSSTSPPTVLPSYLDRAFDHDFRPESPTKFRNKPFSISFFFLSLSFPNNFNRPIAQNLKTCLEKNTRGMEIDVRPSKKKKERERKNRKGRRKTEKGGFSPAFAIMLERNNVFEESRTREVIKRANKNHVP